MTAKAPRLPQFAKKKKLIVQEKILATHFTACAKCGRPTYITATEDPREPYDRLGCFVPSCGYLIP